MKLDRQERHPGYWPSPWPVECGGNRRQKACSGRLDARDGTASVASRENGRWNVMIVERDPDELFLQGTLAAFDGPAPFGWVERIDPDSLEPLAQTPQLPCGGHVWCGAILAHADGSLYTVNGSYMHRVSPDCEVLSERQLPIDSAHNGLLALSDGTLVTKDLRLEGQGPSAITLLAPGSLDVLGEPLQLPEGSMGRIAADRDEAGDSIYVPGTEHLWRLRWSGSRLEIDHDFRPRYRTEGGGQGLAWDGCLSDDALWVMDNGDIESVRRIFSRTPNGRFDVHPGKDLSWQQPAPWTGRQRVLRIDTKGSPKIVEAAPFDSPGGGIIAPPVHVPEFDLVVAWDSIGGGLAGLRSHESELEVVWNRDVRPSMQPVVFPASGELVINDFNAGRDDLVVVDLESGALIDRVATGSRIANGMFLTASGERTVYYCTTGSLARVRYEDR